MSDEEGRLAFTWWGHASSTVELGGTRVSTDPLLTARLLHLRRYATPPTEAAYDADIVVLSHLHHDHLHLPSLRRFGPDVPLLVPKGGERLLRGLGAGRVLPVEPGDIVEVAGVRIEVLPATHDGSRSPLTQMRAPALGFRVEGAGRSFWFPGDTELRDDMADVTPVDLALAPIGGWGPTLETGHMGPEEAAIAVARVGATWATPVHWGTFWPQGLARVMRANHQRLFATPGERFVDCLARDGGGADVVMGAHGETMVL